MSGRRNSYKGKWLALKARAEIGKSIDEGELLGVRADLSGLKKELVELETTIMMISATANNLVSCLNNYSEIGPIKFIEIPELELNPSSEGALHSLQSLLISVEDRVGLLSEATLDLLSTNETASCAPAELRKSSKELATETTRLAKAWKKKERKGTAGDILKKTDVTVRGRALAFERLSPINEEDRFALVPINTKEDTQLSVEGDSNVRKGKDKILPSTPSRGRELRTGPPASRSPSRSKLQKSVKPETSHRRVEAGPSRPLPEVIRVLPDLPGLQDINWTVLRSQLNRTDQLMTKNLADEELYSIALEDTATRTCEQRRRDESLARRIRALI